MAKLEIETYVSQVLNTFCPFEQLLIDLIILCGCLSNKQTLNKLEIGSSENVVIKTQFKNFLIF